MRGAPSNVRLSASMRLLVVIVLVVCALAAALAFLPGVPSVLGSAGSQPEASFLDAARRALAHGQTKDAEALARARPANDSDAAAILAQIESGRGNYDGALRLLEPAAAADPTGEAALELGILLQQGLGRSEAGTQHLTRVFRRAASARDQTTLFRGARAAHALGRLPDANTFFRAAASLGTDPSIETAWGLLFFETFNPPEAMKSFQQVLKIDAEWAPAHLGIARTLANENPPAAAAAAEKALSIDPGLADARLFLAGLDLDNTRYDAARGRIDGVLKANPSNLEARALLAAVAYVRGDKATYDAEASRVLAINPAYGEFYRITGDLLARNYRFDEAVALTRQALALDPSNVRAASDLGLHLMRTGEEAEARRVLDRSFKAFPYDQVTFNLLALLDKLEKFDVVTEGDFVFKFHPEETKVLREYAIPLAQDALKQLSARYQFTPKGPILIEVFPVHDDFAVRNLGLPGLVGALGACFGRVISMDSPKAKAPGTFSWQSTLWHEMAHVVTLQMSRQRVPRWLTEGISVYEEGRARPAWGRDMEVPFALALERGQALPVRDLNSGFTKPETIALAYYEASLLVDHITATHGDAKMRSLIRGYSEGIEGEAAIKNALGVSYDQLQATFDKMLDGRFGSIRAALRDQSRAPADARNTDLVALRAAAAANPGSYRAQLTLGIALASQGDKAAFEPLEKAAALVPMAIGEDSPHAAMGRLAEKLGDTARAISEYRELLVHDHTAIDAARRLAELAAKTNDQKTLALANDRVVEIDPFDAAGHTGLGRVALRLKDAPTAMREFKVALAIGPADRAAAHCDLAESYLIAGRPADAKREALAALEIAPSFERAQELLLRAIDGKGAAGGKAP
jgi:tetratricopeptide (TPR) repeat protein